MIEKEGKNENKHLTSLQLIDTIFTKRWHQQFRILNLKPKCYWEKLVVEMKFLFGSEMANYNKNSLNLPFK